MSIAGIDPVWFKIGNRSSVSRKASLVTISGYQRDRVWCSPSASIAANSTPAKPNQLIRACATVDLPIRPVDCNEQIILFGPGLLSSSELPARFRTRELEEVEVVLIIVHLALVYAFRCWVD